jgi:hypothetical protein
VLFGFGSYDTGNGSNVIYMDAKGNKIVMSNINGRAGAIYLIVPSFLSPNRRTEVLHLNAKHFDNRMASAIATVLSRAANGDFKMSDTVGSADINGIHFESNSTWQQVIESLVFTGDDAILNNPTENNFARRLTLDEQGLHFGDDLYTGDQDFDKLVQFIMDNKTYRIDRQKATDNGSTFGIDLKISQGDTVLFEHKSDDAYSSYLIDDGIVTTDINRTSKNIFT